MYDLAQRSWKTKLKKKNLNIYNFNFTSQYITIFNIPTFEEKNFSSDFLKTTFELMDEQEAKFSVS